MGPSRPPPVPDDEQERLDALRSLGILDTAPEADFDSLAEIAAAVCDTPTALVSFVDAERQWFKAKVGFEPRETSREASFCAHAVAAGTMLVVGDATRDERFAANPLVVDDPRIRFYAGAPIMTDEGRALGTVCAIDSEPRGGLTAKQERVLTALAVQAGRLLELRRLTRELGELVAVRDRTNRALEETRALLVHQALHDPLTALPNRRLLLDRIEHALAGLGRQGGLVAVCFLDLDGFKPVNDRLGHHAGDRLLVELAHRLRSVVRAGDTLARVGGDEFVVVASVASVDSALSVAGRLVEAASQPVDLGEAAGAGGDGDGGDAGGPVAVAASVGVALATSPALSAVALVDEADAAMYRAKRAGGDRVELAS